ncbi:MAG: LamG domain-containing protein [bacterium]
MKEEKILKFFIAIGLVAILISLYIQYGKPFFAELDKQKRDKTRTQNISLINSALEKIQENDSNIFLGEPKTIYVSLPTNNNDCDDLNFHSLPEGWKYSCKRKETFQKLDGNGWIPIDFTKISDNADLGSFLPIDPINTPNNEYYYIYIVDDNDFALIAPMESNRYLKLSVKKDNGINQNKYEIGSPELLKRTLLIDGLRARWDWNFGTQEYPDKTFPENNCNTLVDNIVGDALNFQVADNYATVKDDPIIQNIFNGGGSISVWVYPKSSGGNSVGRIIKKFNEKAGWILYTYKDTAETVKLGFLQRFSNNSDWKTADGIPINSWSHIVVTYDDGDLRNNPIIYVNGKMVNVENIVISSGESASDAGIDLYIGNNPNRLYVFDGYIGEIRLYDRKLTETESDILYQSVFLKND